MKRTLGILAGLGVLGTVGYLGGRLWAQNPPYPPQPAPGQVRPVSAVAPSAAPVAQPTAAPRTRIALINMIEIVKKYRKAQNFQEQMANMAKTIDANELQPVRNNIIKLRQDVARVTDPTQHDQIEKDLRKWQLDLQEKEEDARKRLAKVNGDFTVQLYREIEDAVKLFAKSYDIELVLFYADPTNPADPYNAATVQRKLSIGGAIPIYAAPNMDISDAVVGMLNQRMGPSAAAPAPAPAGGMPNH